MVEHPLPNLKGLGILGADSHNLLGTKLGTYEVQELLGQGERAAVYRGLDVNLHRPVIIKVLAEQLTKQAGFVERFWQETALLASLHHPNIVRLYNFGEQAGLFYLVQEFLPGQSLAQRLRNLAKRREQLGRFEIVTGISQLASALDMAHAAGIVHRDLRPSNVIWNANNSLVLTDFDLAPSGKKQEFLNPPSGLASYLSPEQILQQELTSASDIYTLGVLLYEILTGHVPFKHGLTVHSLQTLPPAVRTYRRNLPSELEQVMKRALAKDPAARFPSAGELTRALRQAWPPITSPRARPSAADFHSQETKIWVVEEPKASPNGLKTNGNNGHGSNGPVPSLSSNGRISTLRGSSNGRVSSLRAGGNMSGKPRIPQPKRNPVEQRSRVRVFFLSLLLILLLLCGVFLAAQS